MPEQPEPTTEPEPKPEPKPEQTTEQTTDVLKSVLRDAAMKIPDKPLPARDLGKPKHLDEKLQHLLLSEPRTVSPEEEEAFRARVKAKIAASHEAEAKARQEKQDAEAKARQLEADERQREQEAARQQEAERKREAELREAELEARYVPTADGWARPVFDERDPMLPKPKAWQEKWHRPLNAVDRRDLKSLSKKMSDVADEIRRVARGHRRSFGYGGPPGIGKSEMCRRILAESGLVENVDYFWHSGRMSGRDMFLWFLHHPNALHIIDDSEDAIADPGCIQHLRKFCELTGRRFVYWRTGAAPLVRPRDTGLSAAELEEYLDDKGKLPPKIQVRIFEVRGAVIIITNDDLRALAKRDGERAKKTGIAALVNRLHPMDVGHRDRRIAVLRLEQLCAEDALGYRKGLSFEEEGELLAAIDRNKAKYAAITIRTFMGAADLRRLYEDWEERLERYFEVEATKTK